MQNFGIYIFTENLSAQISSQQINNSSMAYVRYMGQACPSGETLPTDNAANHSRFPHQKSRLRDDEVRLHGNCCRADSRSNHWSVYRITTANCCPGTGTRPGIIAQTNRKPPYHDDSWPMEFWATGVQINFGMNANFSVDVQIIWVPYKSIV